MHSETDNGEIMIIDETGEIIKELFDLKKKTDIKII